MALDDSEMAAGAFTVWAPRKRIRGRYKRLEHCASNPKAPELTVSPTLFGALSARVHGG
jgi:hypothetical protein